MRCHQDAVVHGEQQDGFGDVVEIREVREPEIRTHHVDLDDLAAGHPSQRIEIVDEAVDVDSSRSRQELAGGGRLIERPHVHAAQLADLPGRQARPRQRVAGIEVPLEPDMDGHAGVLGGRVRTQRTVQIQGDGLLAEDGDAQRARAVDEFRVGIGGRGDDQAIEIRRGEKFVHGPHLDIERLAGTRHALGPRVGNHQVPCQVAEDPGVHYSNASEPQ